MEVFYMDQKLKKSSLKILIFLMVLLSYKEVESFSVMDKLLILKTVFYKILLFQIKISNQITLFNNWEEVYLYQTIRLSISQNYHYKIHMPQREVEEYM